MPDTTLVAAALGVLDGLTEFIPVSSTAHLLLLGQAFGFHSPGNAFAVLIQLGAVLAILLVYAGRLLSVAAALPHDPGARRFVLGVVLAFLPAAVIGVLAHRLILDPEAEFDGVTATAVVGQVLADNRPMLAFVRALGFTLRPNPDDAEVMDARKVL